MPESKSKSLSLLLINDVSTLREWWKTILSEIPGVLVIAEATTPSQALHLFETLRPNAILLEVEVEPEDGFHILREVRKLHPACFVITVSSSRDEERQRRCYASGADYHFSKTDPIDGLIAVLNARLGR